MGDLIIAADLSALGDAAGRLGAVFSGAGHSEELPSLQHPGADAALAEFSSAVAARRQTLTAHAAAGAASLRGFVLAFHHAGE